MYADRGVILTQPEHMSRAFKKFWRCSETARKALARDRDLISWPFGILSPGQDGKIPYKNSITEIDQFAPVTGLLRVKYRLASESTSTVAFFDSATADHRGLLEQALGRLSEFEIVDQSSHSMVVIRPGERGSTAAYARLHGLTL
jgi:hypothetical protein